MSLLDYPWSVSSTTSRLDELEDAFLTWVQDPVKPDIARLSPTRDLPMVELVRQLDGSSTELAPSACTLLGLPAGSTIGTAVAVLLHATMDPLGPRCRSFRSATYYLRRLDRLDADLRPATDHLTRNTGSSRGHPDVR